MGTSEEQDKRRHERHTVMAPAKVVSADLAGEGVLHDVSAQGAGIGIGFDVPVGAEVKISVEGLGELVGTVVRHRQRLGVALETTQSETDALAANILKLVESAAVRKLVMVIEDSLTQAVSLQAALEDDGFKVVCLATAEDALDLLGSVTPDLLIVDYHLPGIQGDELCRRVRMNLATQRIPILMLTSDTGSSTELKGLESGADDYLSKEADTEILLLRVQSLLRSAQTEEAIFDLDDPFFHRSRVLAIDDSPTYLEHIVAELSKDEFLVETARSGAEGIEKVRDGDFDCVLVDMIMPDMEGGTVARTLAEARQNPVTPYVILALSAQEEKENVARALEAGANDFVGKSADASVLKARIRAALRQKFLHDQRHMIITELRKHQDELERAVETRTQHLKAEISERKRIEAELREAKDLADAANRAKSDFLANMSHELRTPLTAIIGFSEAIKTQLAGTVTDWSPEQYGDYIGHIFDSGHHLLNIINDILDISRIEGGKIELEEEDIEVGELIDRTWRFIKGQADKKRITCQMDGQTDTGRVYADRRLMSQALLNLLSNAVKFTPIGGNITVDVGRNKDGGLSIAVSDTGIGIAKQNIPKVLEPFGQVANALSRDHEGTGLGLPLAKSFIELHGGSLSLSSILGRGTVVTVRLPSERMATDASDKASA